MAKHAETQRDDKEQPEMTIGQLRDMLPVDEWVAVPGFPGWRIKRCPDGSVVASAQ